MEREKDYIQIQLKKDEINPHNQAFKFLIMPYDYNKMKILCDISVHTNQDCSADT